jgi:hypothetical protein
VRNASRNALSFPSRVQSAAKGLLAELAMPLHRSKFTRKEIIKGFWCL